VLVMCLWEDWSIVSVTGQKCVRSQTRSLKPPVQAPQSSPSLGFKGVKSPCALLAAVQSSVKTASRRKSVILDPKGLCYHSCFSVVSTKKPITALLRLPDPCIQSSPTASPWTLHSNLPTTPPKSKKLTEEHEHTSCPIHSPTSSPLLNSPYRHALGSPSFPGSFSYLKPSMKKHDTSSGGDQSTVTGG
jgi:hypothetical protein